MASRTTTLCGLFRREAVRRRVSTVCSSKVNVIFTILQPYYHTRLHSRVKGSSRGAATECGPGRKPGVFLSRRSQPKRHLPRVCELVAQKETIGGLHVAVGFMPAFKHNQRFLLAVFERGHKAHGYVLNRI